MSDHTSLSQYPKLSSSRFGRVAFPAFAWALVLHSLVIAVLFGGFGMSAETARVIAAWKELALVALVFAAIVRGVTRDGPATGVCAADAAVGALIAVAVAFLLAANPILGAGLPLKGQLYGFRDAFYFMSLYFVGRVFSDVAIDDTVIRRLYLLAVITSTIAILERLLVSPEMLVALGVASYFQVFLDVAPFTTGNEYGLPQNYWTMIGGVPFRRAGSLYLTGQGFAVPFLLFFPLALTWVFMRERKATWLIVGFSIVCIGLLLTLTRMTIAAVTVQIALFVALRRRPEWALLGLVILGTTLIGAMLFIPGFPMFVWQTLTWQEGSSVSHLGGWGEGVVAFVQRPWGSGLGTADQSAVRAGLKPLTGDSLYLRYAVELGVVGITLLIVSLATIAAIAYRLWRRAPSLAQSRLGMLMLLAVVGIGINGFTAVVFNSVPFGWLFFWFAGAVVTVSRAAPVAAKPARLELVGSAAPA